MHIPISSSLIPLNAEVFHQEGFELSLDAIIPSIELTGSFTPFVSKTQFYIYNYAKTILYENLDYNSNGSYLTPPIGTSTSTSTSSYNQFELIPTEDVYNQGYSSGKYYTVYNFIDYELGSELIEDVPGKLEEGIGEIGTSYDGHPYYLKDISGDRTELRIANNYLSTQQIETFYNQFSTKLDARENADEFYISFGNNRNFIGVNSQLETNPPGSPLPTTILIKLYKPLPSGFQLEQQLQIITKVGETKVFEVEFKPNLEYIDNLLSLKGPNYNISIKDKINNSTNYKTLEDLINTNSSQSYYQFNSLQDQKGVILRKNWAEWSQFVKYSSAEQRLNNFYNKVVSIEGYEDELFSLSTITNDTTASVDYSSSWNNVTNNINKIIGKFDSYEYFLYYITGSSSWPKYTTTYPYKNYSYSSSQARNWFGSTDESSVYYNSGKNQIYSASRYDNDNQDYLYYLIPPFITENSSNDQYIKFVNMTGQAFDEMYLYTEAVEQVRNTNSTLTGSVLPLGLADEVIESLGFDTYGNDFNSVGFNVNGVGAFPATGSGLEYIDRYIDIASGSVINYYDTQQSTLGYVIALADPSFPYPLENSAQEIYKRIFHNMVSLVKRKGTVTGLRQLINIWGVPNTMLRISEFGGKNKDDENDYDLWMNRYSTALTSYPTPTTSSINQTSVFGDVNANAMFPWLPLAGNYLETATTPDVAVPDCIQFRFKTARDVSGTTNFSESILLKRGQDGFGGSNRECQNGDFGIYLHQSGSNSGSYSGAIDPHYNTYASMSFVISGSIVEGASYYRDLGGTFYANCYVTDPIYLPFYNEGWWTVQIQRMTHLSASNEDNTLNEYELKVGQNIYDGYDGNQIGWLASSSLTMIDSKVSQSMNEAWNRFYMDDGPGDLYDIHNYMDSQVFLPGNIFKTPTWNAPNCVGKADTFTVPGFNLGDTMSGSFQEFRYYRRALSSSAFLDLVMNPESIQGHSDSNYGLGSSYDLLSYRVPLGNELEFTEQNGSAAYFDASGFVAHLRQFAFGQLIPTSENAGSSGGVSVGSVHPSAINYDIGRSLFTGSFFNVHYKFPIPDASTAIQPYFLNFRFTSNPNLYITSSYIVPNTEINYMDQPAAGIRNRIKNKIQVIDGNEYGTTLSPFRSIQQEFEQSASYTEDLNSLEVGFSFQNEINDDIIATFGHGVVSDAIADPRFISESNDRYPELTRIAEDYFKKYQGFTINTPLFTEKNVTSPPHIIESEYDYNRLIKFYETSLFKAIKNYIPARTSLSTGIIVKQHLLERNKTNAVVGINIDTPIARTPETGSENGLNNAPQSNNSRIFTPGESGFNSPIQQENLLITSSINMYSLTGSAGGSVNKYNILENPNCFISYTDGATQVFDSSMGYMPLYNAITTTSMNTNNLILFGTGSGNFIKTSETITTNFQVDLFCSVITGGAHQCHIKMTSNKRGDLTPIDSTTTINVNGTGLYQYLYPGLVTIYPDEEIQLLLFADLPNFTITTLGTKLGNDHAGTWTIPISTYSSSQQAYWTLDNYTGDQIIKDTQDEFYNGEFSGSNVPMIPPQYNPYRIYADGNDLTPDVTPFSPEPDVDFTQGGGNPALFTAITPHQLIASGTGAVGAWDFWTGSYKNLIPGVTYTLSASISSAGSFNKGWTVYAGYVGPTLFWHKLVNASGLYQVNYNFVASNEGVGDLDFQPFTSGPGAGFDNGGGAFLDVGANTMTLNFHSLVASDTLGPKHLFPRDAWTIVPTQSQIFQNSPYNPLLHNVSGSRANSFLYDMDFDPVTSGSTLIEGIPSDYSLTISASQLGWEGSPSTTDALLEYAQVPDSNYTIPSIINPRYNGSKITSADYNFSITQMSLSESIEPSSIYSPLRLPSLINKKSHIQELRFLNGEIGGWVGDSTNEFQSAIDTRPIYIAHFKSSYENFELYNTSTFDIDQLIRIPFESIQSTQTPIITSSQLNGNNENLIPVASTFVPERKLKAYYNQTSKQFRKLLIADSPSSFRTESPVLNYAVNDAKSKYITFPAQEIVSYYTNEKSRDKVILTHSIDAPIWVNDSINYTELFTSPTWNIQNTRNNNPLGSVYSPLTNSIQPLPLNSVSQSTSLLTTGSSPKGDEEGYGLLYVQGMSLNATDTYEYNFGSMSPSIRQFDLSAPHLQIINSMNSSINLGDISYSTSQNPWLYPDGTVNTTPSNSCAQWEAYEGGEFFPWCFCVSAFVNTPLHPTSNSNYREGGGLPSFPTNPIRTTMRKGPQNYFKLNYSQSTLAEYTDKDLPIMIERGDEIRVTYAYPLLRGGGSAISNTSKLNEIVTQDFLVLGYEMAPPSLLFERPLEYNGTSKIGWGSNNAMLFGWSNEFISDVRGLPPTGLYSPDSLKEKFDLLVTNQQNVIGMNISTNNLWSNAFSGSVVSCDILTRWGEPSGSSNVIAPTGSIRVKFKGYKGASSGDTQCQVGTVQEILRTTMRGNSGSYQEPLGSNIPSSQYSFAVDDGSTYHPLDPAFIFDTLKVYPNPTTLSKQIPAGAIMSATFKKRIDNDTKVVVNMTQPLGQEGAQTPSGDGYLVPDDLTSIQQDNVQKIINVLKSQNSFTNPPDANETQDVS